jgi:hypothetical protein
MIAWPWIRSFLLVLSTGRCGADARLKLNVRPSAPVPLLAGLILLTTPAQAKVTLSLSQASGGVPILGASPNYSSGLGNVNGLGAGTPGAGITILTAGVASGVLYTTPYNLAISGLPGSHVATVSTHVSANFAHPAILILRSCSPGGACSSAANFITISLNSGVPTALIAAPGVPNGSYTATLGLFVSSANGAGTFTGSDSATINFTATDTTNGQFSSVNLVLNNPSENVQTAVRFFLATAPGGRTISPAADFAMDFGNVNGLGISPTAGLTIVSSAGGVIYSTPYLLQPSFSSFVSTTGSLDTYVSADFVHPAILELRDASASEGPYTAISTSSATRTVLTTSAASGADLTRYLGLFVSEANGPIAFTGSDNATLTYTLTVP